MITDKKDIAGMALPSDDDRKYGRVEPWHDEVKGGDLLDGIASSIREFVSCPVPMARAMALWAAMSWFPDVIRICPFLFITAPDKGCGKSQALKAVGQFVYKPQFCSNITKAALYRIIEERRPTLLIDEVDAFLKQDAGMVSILNGSHERSSARVIRTAMRNDTPDGTEEFSTWAPKAFAGIGRLDHRIMSRSIVIELERKPAQQSVKRVEFEDAAVFGILNRKIARWVEDSREHVRAALQDMQRSDYLGNRLGDNWEALRAIALVAGGHWSKTADATARILSEKAGDDPSIGAELLRDINIAFRMSGEVRLPTARLLGLLYENDERPWATYGRNGRQMSAAQLAGILRRYGVSSHSVSIGDSRPKGYRLEDLASKIAAYAAKDEDRTTDLLGPLLGDMGDDERPQD
ncbi:DUF3631 domain-containing protein [Paraburkholderia sediminicola]|uniref:DUF3631 domain-containing protein n=1 Tax=Paraburkholderia sediminicola TaxID=458836 RepID=UPI0038BB3212